MSINKILNRPMFRREALRKGHLKPLKAQTGRMIGPMRPPVPALIPQSNMGTMVGSPYNNALALRAQPNFMERMASRARGFGRGVFSLPALGGYYAGDKVGQALGIESDLGRTPFGLGGAYLATRALPTLAGIGLLPSAAILATGAGIKNRVDAGIAERKRINAMSPKERADFERQNRLKATDYMSEGVSDQDIFGKFDPKTLDDIVKKDTETKLKRQRKRGQTSPESKTVDIATEPQNTTRLGKKNAIDTAKIAENALPPQISDTGGNVDNMSGALPPDTGTNLVAEKTEEDKETKKTSSKNNTTADEDAVASTSPFAEQINLARQIAKEMRTGKTSNANLVFLTNLASGLLTGTTKRQGIGGALEVFGQALGPAVNNMVMVKMKEDEIEQNLLGRALEFSTDFLKAQNEAFEMPDTKEVGVIQYTNEAGRTVNVAGRVLIDGTKQINTGKKDANGLNIFQTVDPNLNFLPNSDQNKETLDLAKSIAGKYAAVNLINRSLGIIEKGEAQAGVTGAFGLYGGRVTEALGDVFDFVKVGGDDVSEVKAAGKAMFNLQRETAAADLVSDGVFDNKQQALNYLDRTLGSFEKNRRSSLSNAKKRLKGGNALDYERLAINETVLVYKLANSLKSKDRLTQKDIEMAKGLVKVFPLLRGERNVIASLTATAETILDDIKQQERLYERAGGSSQYLLDERRAYGLIPNGTTLDTFEEKQFKFRELEKKIGEMTEEDFKKIFPNL
jgi:hypothetical protein